MLAPADTPDCHTATPTAHPPPHRLSGKLVRATTCGCPGLEGAGAVARTLSWRRRSSPFGRSLELVAPARAVRGLAPSRAHCNMRTRRLLLPRLVDGCCSARPIHLAAVSRSCTHSKAKVKANRVRGRRVCRPRVDHLCAARADEVRDLGRRWVRERPRGRGGWVRERPRGRGGWGRERGRPGPQPNVPGCRQGVKASGAKASRAVLRTS